MRVFRIAYRAFSDDPLNGEGSFLFGGRWSSPGVRIAYTSTTVSLAMIEFLAHIDTNDFDETTPPALVYVTAEIPDEEVLSLPKTTFELSQHWNSIPAPALDAILGDEWVRAGVSLALVVPSVHIPPGVDEYNVLINPQHKKFQTITRTVEKFNYDTRLLS